MGYLWEYQLIRKLIAIALFLTAFATYGSVSVKALKQVYDRELQHTTLLTQLFPADLYVDNDPEINAFTINMFNEIIVNTGLLDNARNIHEVAFVVGHELGHKEFYHMGSNHRFEYQADQRGAYLANASGYDVCKGIKWFKGLPNIESNTHPLASDRYRRLAKIWSCKED